MERQRLIQLIDACRPGSDDHQHGELAEVLEHDEAARELFDQVQALDGRLVEMFQEVPVPAGLRERIEQSLATGVPAEATAMPAETTGEDAAIDCDELPPLVGAVSAVVKETSTQRPALEPAPVETAPTGRTRRRWLTATLSGAGLVAAVLVATVMLWPKELENLSARQVAGQAEAWGEDLNPAAWKTNIGWAIQEFPVPEAVGAQPHRWQSWQDPWRVKGHVYDLSPGLADGTVLLYVSRAVDRVDDLPFGPPPEPQFNSGNVSVAVWEWGDMLYVLVIHGPRNNYERLIKPAEIAWLSPPARFRG